jgi:periplasmic protein TonB
MGYHALLFCPDEKTARTVTHVLNDLDFTVEPCTEPFAAVKKLMAQHFDAVVVDCDNEQNATLLFKSARNSTSNQSSLAVAVVEGQAGVAKAFRIGANLVLTKPINVEQAKGTLRVARGLLRKGSEAPKAASPPSPAAGQVAAPATKPAPLAPAAPPSRVTTQPSPSASTFAPAASPKKPAIPALPTKPAFAATPSLVASTYVAPAEVDDQDSILEADEPATPPPAFEDSTSTMDADSSPSASPKFPWQPSPKMAEPMASALRRAAEAAGQVETTELPLPTKAPAAPPAPEKRPMTGAMFQAQGHAAATAPARTIEKPPAPVSAAPAAEEVVTKPAARETFDKPIVDTTRDDVAPPTFFPGGYEADEVEGGGKTKALIIVAAVVLLASSAGYLSWRNMNGKNASAATRPTQNAPAAAPTTAAADAPAASETAAPSQPVATDITLASSSASSSATPSTSAPRPSAAKLASKPSATAPEPDPEPDVTQRLVVRSDTRHLASASAPHDAEAVQPPSAIGLEGTADTKALASISNAAVAKPTPQMLKVSQGVMEGLVLKRVQPRYPSQALQMRIQGPVQLQATITKDGDIANLKVVSGDAVLAKAAQEAVKQWKYKPYYLNGEPVQIETQILVNFRLPN